MKMRVTTKLSTLTKGGFPAIYSEVSPQITDKQVKKIKKVANFDLSRHDVVDAVAMEAYEIARNFLVMNAKGAPTSNTLHHPYIIVKDKNPHTIKNAVAFACQIVVENDVI